MDSNIPVLMWTAATVGFVHTLLGPDHYVPFVAMSRAGRWTKARTLTIAALCGVGHVMGSVLLGVLGIALGWAVGEMEWFEAERGGWAAWALIAVGLAYGVWGIRQGIRNRPHTHAHVHSDGVMHEHRHVHQMDHAHVHTRPDTPQLTPWVLFTVFVLGPCEPLIPILMVPAATHSWWGVLMVAAVFGAVTIVTMTGITYGLLYGLDLLSLRKLERWSHALAGFAIFASGGAIRWLGL